MGVLPPPYKIKLHLVNTSRALWKRKWLLVLLFAVVFLGVVGMAGQSYLKTAQRPKPPRFETVRRGVVETKVTETGTIEPLKKVEVKSKVAGRIAKLYVQEGSQVKAGQLLAEIDPTEINSQVAQMRAQLDGAKARLAQSQSGVVYQDEQTRTGIRQAEEGLRSAQARLKAVQEENRAQPKISASEVEQAEAGLKAARDSLTLMKKATHPQELVELRSNLDEMKTSEENAQLNLTRQENLLKKGFVSKQEVEAARSELASAHARYEQAKNRMDLLQDRQQLEIADANNKIKQAQASLNRARAGESLILVKRQDVQSAFSAVQQAKAQWEAALSNKEQNSMRRASVLESRAAVSQLQNQLNEVAVRQHDTRLIASNSGVVTKRYIEEGELITSGVNSFSSGTPVVQIADLSHMLVKMTVNEVDVNKIRPGLPVEIRVDGVRNVVFNGRLQKVSPASLSFAPGADQGGQGGGRREFRHPVCGGGDGTES